MACDRRLFTCYIWLITWDSWLLTGDFHFVTCYSLHVSYKIWDVTLTFDLWFIASDIVLVGHRDLWYATCDKWHKTFDLWLWNCELWHVTCDIWHVTWTLLAQAWHPVCLKLQEGWGELAKLLLVQAKGWAPKKISSGNIW